MFGFLQPLFRDTKYRQAYARCCSMQHLEFGVSSLPFLSYEAVLLYQLTIDCGFNPGPPATTATCCRLRTSRRLRNEADAEFARFAAAFGVLLGLIKLDDDVRDEGGLISRLAHWTLARRQAAVNKVFTEVDDHFAERVEELIDEHLNLERNWQHNPVSLAEYAEPTARSFGYLFSLAARQNDIASAEQKKLLTSVGESIGRAILAFDCAADWYQDRHRGRFNPLPDESSIESALDLACASLDQAAWLCETQCGETSLSARVLASVFERTAAFTPKPIARRRRPQWKQQLSEWGLMREPGYVYARCDCCCELLCDGAGQAAGCGEFAACCGEGPGCGCEGLVCCGEGCCDPCCDKASGRAAELEKLVGETGLTRNSLKPNGVILINGKRERARAESGVIPANTQVEVVEVLRSRLIVRRLDEPESVDSDIFE